MLKKFFLNTLSSFVGAWIALVLFGIVAVLVGIGIVAKIGISAVTDSSAKVSKGSVLVIELSGELQETETPSEFDYFSLAGGRIEKTQTLAGLKRALAAAKENKNVEALYIKCKGVMASPATLNALREAVADFKESGKKVIAYGDGYGLGDYYVASVADEIFLNPGGAVAIKGLGGMTLFYKGLLDKLGVDVQVIKVGTYKSAVEPFIHTQMSEPARAQLDTLYGNMWAYMTDRICADRESLTPSYIDSLVSKVLIFTANARVCVNSGLVDRLEYERSMDSIIASAIGKDKDKLNFVSPSLLDSQEIMASAFDAKEQIAVLYATGEIVDGGGKSTINFEKFVPIITDLADNDNVKGLVLRVNSPGGSAFGSEQIGEALDYFQSKGKPLAVSMGDFAASGGYWISAGADRIFADPLTITGSIGIFGLIPNLEGLMQKLGLNAEFVSTNPEADFPNIVYPMNPVQLDAMQKMVEEGYDKFVGRVAKGRHLTDATVRRIGEGRVWDAQKAVAIGLVDQLGDMQDAIEWVADKAGVKNYGLPVYPQIENTVWDFLPQLMDMQIADGVKNIMGDGYSRHAFEHVMLLFTQKPLNARMAEEIIFNTRMPR